jgi:hypothetical protein
MIRECNRERDSSGHALREPEGWPNNPGAIGASDAARNRLYGRTDVGGRQGGETKGKCLGEASERQGASVNTARLLVTSTALLLCPHDA